MSIRNEARQEAAEYARRHVGGMQPVETVGDKVRAAFEAGAVWAREQDTRGAQITGEMVTRADLAIQGFWGERYPVGSLTTEIARAALEAALGKTRETEQADPEPSERLMVAPAIQAVRDVLDGLEDWEIEDRAFEEIRSAVDDIPDCESATAIPHEEHGEPSDTEVEAERIAWLDARQAAYRADSEAWHVHYEIAPEEVGDAFFRGWDAAHASHLAAQEVRRGD